jgi:hypothetical protein
VPWWLVFLLVCFCPWWFRCAFAIFKNAFALPAVVLTAALAGVIPGLVPRWFGYASAVFSDAFALLAVVLAVALAGFFRVWYLGGLGMRPPSSVTHSPFLPWFRLPRWLHCSGFVVGASVAGLLGVLLFLLGCLLLCLCI